MLNVEAQKITLEDATAEQIYKVAAELRRIADEAETIAAPW